MIDESFKEIEDIIEKMENQDISLEESFSLFETGMKKLKNCNDQIDKIEKKLLILTQDKTLIEFEEN
ncbi:MAG: exodeoxyribonuclease VII small subunit [Lachnospiraceae bacterium]